MRDSPVAGPGRRLLVTGGAGFIGSCFVREILGRRDGTRVTVLDKLTYAGNRANLAAIETDPEQASRFRFVHGDIAAPDVVGPLVAEADAVVNFAAETHVDRSILEPEAFLATGVVGVHVLLEALRNVDARAVIVGFGDYRAELEQTAPPRTLFTGPLDHRRGVGPRALAGRATADPGMDRCRDD